MTKLHPSLELITNLGGLLGIKTKSTVARLSLAGLPTGPVVATIDHRFSGIAVTCTVPRDTAATICGPWLDALAGDQIAVELGAETTVAHSDEAALPADAPEIVRALGGDLESIGWDGEVWSYALTQSNADEAAVEATIARFDAIAELLEVTGPQRRTGANLHRSLSRGNDTRCIVRTRDGKPERLTLAWDEVEWLPIQHMMRGFYPQIDSATKISRLSNAVDVDHATIELVLGPSDPPGMRIRVQLPQPVT